MENCLFRDIHFFISCLFLPNVGNDYSLKDYSKKKKRNFQFGIGYESNKHMLRILVIKSF